jgi:hypothetical protein
VIIQRIPLGVLAIDDSILSLERSTKGEMIACLPKAVLPRESAVEGTNGRDDIDWVGVVLGSFEKKFGNRLLLFEGYLCELSFAMSIRDRDNKH